ncbi:MAG: alpha/beta hydrolase [bacterium]|nr:alpha/beta hydrolase [bacterium]
MASEADALEFADLSRRLDDAIEGLDIYRADQTIPTAEGEAPPARIRELRRAGGSLVEDTIATMTLLEDDGILRWQPGLGFRPPSSGRRGRRRFRARGSVVKQLKFRTLEKSQVGEALANLDKKLTPERGLRRWNSLSSKRSITRPPQKGKVLLFVHGTFSHSDSLFQGLEANPEGKAFFQRAKAKYGGQILSFDHPTLSVNPFLNSVELERLFEGSEATVDVICHSRGGLVTRWWAEELCKRPETLGKLVLVGSPLAGTSLAAAPRLRASLDYLTNVGNVLESGAGMAATAFPLLAAVTGILRVVATATKIVSKTPMLDAAIAMIPGLSAQARTGDNPSIDKLRSGISAASAPEYYVIRADFEPPPVGWKFWRAFQNPGDRIKNFGADLVFDEANDLVVNTASMDELSDDLRITRKSRVRDFGTTSRIHHTNYFEQAETTQSFTRWLDL